MASSRASEGTSGRGGRFRSLIPFLRKRSVLPPPVATESLAVRPPWWRMTVRRMVNGLWPGFRAGQSSPRRTETNPAAGRPERLGSPERPLLAQRIPLAGKTSVLPARRQVQRKPLTAAKPAGPARDTVVGGLAPELTMAPPPGLAFAGAPEETATPEVSVPASAALAQQTHYVTVQREAARVSPAGPPARSLVHPSTPARRLAQKPPVRGSVVAGSVAQTPVAQTPAAQRSALRVQRSDAEESPAVAQPATPEQRWRDAVASVPLETPRAFPTHMRPLVAQLTGRPDGASYTTGTATRRALAEVGAAGATTGSVVHLADRPSMAPASLGVLAHELSHARSPVSRPRFMLHDHVGHMDSDERQARSVGEQFHAAANTIAPVRVQRFGLPSASSLVGGLTNRATDAVSSLGHQATGMAGGLADRARSAIGDGVSAAHNYVGDAAGAAGNAVSGLRDQFSSAASGLGNQVADGVQSVSAGLVDRLPVGGTGVEGVAGAVTQLARDAAQSAVQEASQLSQNAQQMLSNAQSMANQGVDGLAGQAGQLVDGAMGQANQWVNGAVDQASGAVQGLGDQAASAVGAAQNAVGGLANRAMGALGPGAAQALSGVDLDRIAEALEERLLRQLERRGGRYAGVF